MPILERASLAYARIGWLVNRMKLRRFDPASVAALDGHTEEITAFAFDAYRGSLAPRQSRWEFQWFVDEVARRRPRTVVEIGTSRGGSLLGLCRAAADDATVVSVDIPAGLGGSGYPRWKEDVLHAFAKPGQDLHLVRADSAERTTVERVAEILDGRPLDLLFIDGDHSYEGVRADWEGYSPMVGPGGVAILHDVLPNPWNPSVEVDAFWEDRLADSAHTRVVRDPGDMRRFGFGVVEFPA